MRTTRFPARATPHNSAVAGESNRGEGVSAAARALGRHGIAVPLAQEGLTAAMDTPVQPCRGLQDPAYVASAGALLQGIRHLSSIDSVRKQGRRLNRDNGYTQFSTGPLNWLRERVKKVAL